MKKIGILSMQRIFNYGSFLQAYGLKQILTELGGEVSFVDYHPGKCLIESDQKKGLARKISKVTEVFKYKAPLREKIKFIKYKKNYAAKYYPLLGISERMNYNPVLDVLVIGSDEVFNCVQDNTNVGFSPELFGNDSKASKLISYAASFGNTTLAKLEKYGVSDEVAGYLKKFECISVRDKNSFDIVKKLAGTEPIENLDPVLAYDYLNKCKEIPEKVEESKYMILYGYSGRFSEEECRTVRKYASDRGLKIFCIGGVQNACDKFIDCDPFKVISYFKNADCVVTDTFHGTILSVITRQNFVTFVRKSGYGNSEKLIDLLDRLMLNQRIINDLTDLDKLLNEKFDYTQTNSIIEDQRRKTYDYLKSQIN